MMLSTLPDFTPRDSHYLWYISSRSAPQPNSLRHPNHADHPMDQNAALAQSRSRNHAIERTALARLTADELQMQRRKIHVQNFGSSWLRPLGFPKTLNQMREEKREQEEHQEALRREQLAQELAEAEEGMMMMQGGRAGGGGDPMMDDVQLDGAQDLDDEIPDADADHRLGLGRESDSDEDRENELGEDDEDDDEDDDDDADVDDDSAPEELNAEAIRQQRQNNLMAARLRLTDDAFREALVRGDPDDDFYGGEEELPEEQQGQMLDEEDFAHHDDTTTDNALGMGMGANLDDDIPEAETELYEHTDSDADLSTSSFGGDGRVPDDHHQDAAMFAPPRATGIRAPVSPTLRGRMASGPRSSLDISHILSQDESSFMDSSPAQRRRRA